MQRSFAGAFRRTGLAAWFIGFFGLIASFPSIAQDVTQCPSGWRTGSARENVPKTGASGSNYQRVTIALDIPASAEVMGMSNSLSHPKFCWKEESSSKWECWYNDPSLGEWMRFEVFRPDGKSPRGSDFKRYTVVAQNESADRNRNAMLVICYR